MSAAGNVKAGRAYVEILLDQTKLERGLKQAQAKLKNFGSALTGVGKSMVAVATVAAAPIAYARILRREITDRLPSSAQLSAEFSVSPATAKKVIDHMKLAGWVYGEKGRGIFVRPGGLVPGSAGTIGVFLSFPAMHVTYYMKTISALREKFANTGMVLRVFQTVPELLVQKPDWVIAFDEPAIDAEYESIQRTFGQRVICVNRESPHFFSVVSDNRRIGFMAIDSLYRNGHRKVGIIARELRRPEPNFFAQRFQGCLDVAQKHADLELFHVCIAPDSADNEENFAPHAVRKMLDEHPDVTAIFAFTDDLALAAISELQRRKVSVPEEISLLSVDNREFTQYLNPPLTSIEEPGADCAEVVSELLLGNLSDGLPGGKAKMIAPKLTERESVAIR